MFVVFSINCFLCVVIIDSMQFNNVESATIKSNIDEWKKTYPPKENKFKTLLDIFAVAHGTEIIEGKILFFYSFII